MSFMEQLYERVEWIKEKTYMLIITLMISATFSLITLAFTLTLFLYLEPEPYKTSLNPEFQLKTHN